MMICVSIPAFPSPPSSTSPPLTLPPVTLPSSTTGGPDVPVCFSDGEVNSGPFIYSYNGPLTSFEGPVEICVNGLYESVCDIGWDEVDAQALCRYQLGGNVGKLLLV